MKFHLKYLFLLLILLFAFRISLLAYIPVNDTLTKKAELKTQNTKLTTKKDSFIVRYYFRSSLDTTETPKTVKINYSLDKFQIYDPAYFNYSFPLTLGNMGLANKNLMFSPNNESGFDLGMHNFDSYMFTEGNLKYYQVRTPFTELSTVLAAKKEQMIEVKHYQNIKRLINIGLDYRVIGSIGEYTRERADDNSFSATADYFSKNKRYYAAAGFIHNRIKAEENGGIIDSTNFDPKLSNTINLSNAYSHVRMTDISIKQFYNLSLKKKAVTNKPNTKSDTLKDNSFQSDLKPQTSDLRSSSFFDPGTVSWYFSFNRKYQAYDDRSINTDFYPAPLYNASTAFDSIIIKKHTNSFEWSPALNTVGSGLSFIKFFFRIKSENIQLFNKYDDQQYYFLNIIPSAGFITNPDNKFSFMFNSEYAEGNYNKSNFNLSGSFAIRFNKQHDTINKFILNAYILNKNPEWTQNYYVSDFFQWNNNFKKSTTSYFNAAYLYKKLNLGINYYILNNFLYFNQYARPAQASQNFYTYSAYINYQLAIGNFQLNNRLVYQYISNQDYMHLPEYLVYESAFYNFRLFKKALIAQAGLDFWYSSAYYADKYMPATREFYIQNEKKLSENISIDPFINVRIKRAKVFVKYQHSNYLLAKQRTYLSPLYPLQDAALKLGILWRFFD
jgi:hypothetical protein